MVREESQTKKRILEAGKEEFLSKGFPAASLRRIAKEAGVTTGAFYGYYSGKEELFDALVREKAEVFMNCFMKAQTDFAQLPPDEQKETMGDISGDAIDWMTEYIFDNYDIFKLIICCSEGTGYMNFIHEMVEIEVDATYRFIDTLKEAGYEVKSIDESLCHIIVSSMFQGYFEIVRHDMGREAARRHTAVLKEFHYVGWKRILGI